MKKKFFQYILFYLMLFLCHGGVAQINKVWALGDGEKVFRDDLHHPSRQKNLTWDGTTIRLQGGYNEVLAFQIIVESGAKGINHLEVSVDAPLNQNSGRIIGANTLKYGDGGTIELFSEHYLLVKDSTHPNWFYGSAAAAPKKMTGWIPDALIPLDALSGSGGFPNQVAPHSNQGFWVDVYLPRDRKNYPNGIYTGSVNIMQEGKSVFQMTLEVTLLPYYLPDENKTNIWLFTSNSSVYGYYPQMSHRQVDEMLKFEGHRHRIEVTGGFEVNGRPFSEEKMEEYKSYLNGDAFTPSAGYHGPGQGIGEKLFPIGMYGSPVLGDNKAQIQQQSDLWVTWFTKNAPAVTYFWYMTDEPGRNKYPWIRERARWVKENPGPGRSLPTFTTTGFNSDLSGAIDIWAAFNGVDLKVLSEIRMKGGDHWFYNGNRPRYGSVILEGAAVDLRVNSWILYKYDIHTHFIWHGTHWDHNGQGPKKNLHQNIFNNPLTFINDQMEFGNGDGIIFYPGHMPFFPSEERGLNRIIPSIRLKNIRRGQQDALIMWMAEQKVGKQRVINLIGRVVPKALSEVSMKEAVPWSQYGDDYEKVRQELIQLLLK